MQAVDRLLELLETLRVWVDETPPTDQPQRFGNKAFSQWLKKVSDVRPRLLFMVFLFEQYFFCTQNTETLIEKLLPDSRLGAVVELKVYFLRKCCISLE